MSKFSTVSTLHLVTASVVLMVALLGVKSNDLVRELLVPAAHAETARATAAGPALPPAPPPASAAVCPSLPTPVATTTALPASDEEKQLLQELRARKQTLDEREQSVSIREAALASAETRLTDRVQELKALQDNLQKLQDASNQRDDANWEGLVSVYEAMKPQAAATILNSLDMPVLLQIFNRMKDRKAALILSEMDPDRARLVTVELAKMRATQNSPNASKS